MEAAARRAILGGIVAGVGTSVVLVAYWLSIGALTPVELRRALHSRTAATQVIGIYFLGGLGTVGVPTALYLRYRLVSPLALLVAIVAFWGLAENGDSPASLFVLALWPAYLVAFVLVGGLEYWLREATW